MGGRLSVSGTRVGAPGGFVTNSLSFSSKTGLPRVFSSWLRVIGLRSKSSSSATPSSRARLKAASMSVKRRLLRPSTAFQPGTSWPSRHCSRMYSSSFVMYPASSRVLVRMSLASSRLIRGGSIGAKPSALSMCSAWARQVAAALQNRQCSPGTNSPSPLKARIAAGLIPSAHSRRAGVVVSQVCGSGLTFGW